MSRVTPRLEVDNNFDKCPICKAYWKDCKHSLSEMTRRVWEDWIRKIVRDEMEK